MSKNALVAGATGSTGKHLVRQLNASPEYENVVVAHRRPTGFGALKKVTEILLNFDNLEEEINPGLHIDDIFCALGTTMKKAGSKEQFKKVDHDYVMALARWAEKHGAHQFTVVSSIGAKAGSPFFYMKTKGEMEQHVQQTGVPVINIMHPSILEDPDREEKRLAEKLSLSVMKGLSALMPGLLKNHKPTPVWMLAHAMITVAQKPVKGIRYYNTHAIHHIAERQPGA